MYQSAFACFNISRFSSDWDEPLRTFFCNVTTHCFEKSSFAKRENANGLYMLLAADSLSLYLSLSLPESCLSDFAHSCRIAYTHVCPKIQFRGTWKTQSYLSWVLFPINTLCVKSVKVLKCCHSCLATKICFFIVCINFFFETICSSIFFITFSITHLDQCKKSIRGLMQNWCAHSNLMPFDFG